MIYFNIHIHVHIVIVNVYYNCYNDCGKLLNSSLKAESILFMDSLNACIALKLIALARRQFHTRGTLSQKTFYN